MSSLPRYLLVGVGATALHYGVYALLLIMIRPAFAAVFGTVAGAVTAYFGNRRWTFASTRSHRRAMPAFVTTSAAMAAGNGGIVSVCAPILGPWPAQLLATGAMALAGFVSHRRWSFGG